MAFFIRQEHYQLMIDHCLAARPNEACGLLGGRNGRGEEIFLTSNSKESPTTYEVDPEQLVVILQGLAEAGRELVAVFHSHPTGRAFPSAEDIRLAFYPEAHYVIVGLSPQVEVRAFRIVEGRVSEAEMLIERGSCATGQPSPWGG